MRDPKLLLVAFILVAGSTSVYGQFNLDSVKNTFSNAGQDIANWGRGVGQDISAWGSGASKDVADWGRGVMNKINGFKDRA
ncbi:hypothetical protein SK128_022419 [Halocaridina rubra]|uniref:Uncharacterized protein n=1 Tax=Halocaridina rubra TaxID=373956 RepID=A0AAN8X754_HALRR